MAENLPDWAFIDAEVVFVSSPTGMGRDTVTKAVITKITPTGQIVTSASELRFKPRDYIEKDNYFHRYRSDGRFSYGSINLYPRAHPKVPKMLAQQERNNAWTNVTRGISKIERQPTPEKARALRIALEVWERAAQRVEDA